MFAIGYRPRDKCEWLDAYNKVAIRGGAVAPFFRVLASATCTM